MLVRIKKKLLYEKTLFFFVSIEINQKVQNSTVGSSKVHTNTEQTGIERSNSTGGRKNFILKENNNFLNIYLI
jgi:hypothetical protein